MTVLPYIVVSLIAGLGRIRWSERRRTLVAAIAVLAVLLGLGALTLALVPLAFPTWSAASFYSESLIESPARFDFAALYIPSNPFRALSESVVPAVVLFSITLGIGLGGVPGNDGILRSLEVLAAALNRVNKMMIQLTPYGVFAIAADTAGTISIAELNRLQTYVVTYTVIALVLSFVVLPLLVTAVTPFRYRDLISVCRDTLITIFAAAKIIVVLPQLIENVKELFRRYDLDDDAVESGAELLMPLAYPFPNLGTYAILMFVPFSAWYLGRTLEWDDQLAFQVASLLGSFVAPIIGIPFLLELLQIPSDMMDLFIVSTVYTDRVRVVLGAMHLFVLTIVTLAVGRGVFKVDWRRLGRTCAVCAIAVVVAALAVRVYLDAALAGGGTSDAMLVGIEWKVPPAEPALVRKTLPEPLAAAERSGPRLDAIKQRGSLRVGYLRDSLPFAFVSQKGEVTGFDVELAQRLAQDLGVRLELVRLTRAEIGPALETGQVDAVMSGLAITAGRALEWDFAASPLDLTLAFLVPDHQRAAFSELRRLDERASLTLGVIQSDPAMQNLVKTHFPSARIETVTSPRSFLRGKRSDLDAVVYSAEGGSAWTLIYPDFSVAVPLPLLIKLPAGYPVPRTAPAWSRFLSQWIEIKRKDGTIEGLYAHWILGEGSRKSERRWSIVRDVLHWVE